MEDHETQGAVLARALAQLELTHEERVALQRLRAQVPATKVTIQPDAIDAWRRSHAHPDEPKGAIGGHLTQSMTPTSIGAMETWFCGCCREEAYVDHDF